MNDEGPVRVARDGGPEAEAVLLPAGELALEPDGGELGGVEGVAAGERGADVVVGPDGGAGVAVGGLPAAQEKAVGGDARGVGHRVLVAFRGSVRWPA